jgi:hypothetical protein
VDIRPVYTPLPPSRKSNYGDVNITLGRQNMPVPLSGGPKRRDIAITSGVKEIPVSNSRKQIDRVKTKK